MKPKKISKKLGLNKRTVAHLSTSEISKVKGGALDDTECCRTAGSCVACTTSLVYWKCDTTPSWCVY